MLFAMYFFDGFVDAIIAPITCCGVLVGNIDGVKDINLLKNHPDKLSCPSKTEVPNIPESDDSVMAITRSSRRKKESLHPLKLPKLDTLDLTPVQFAAEQKSCKSLTKLWDKAKKEDVHSLRDGSKFKFVITDSLLYRICLSYPNKTIIGRCSLVLPALCRAMVLQTAHEAPVAGHFSHNKTFAKISCSFFWPGASQDVRNYCKSCDVCQRMSINKAPKVPLVKMPIIETPYSRISMDIVGPMNPMSARGHKYILTVIDWATGFPEAVPLKTIDSISVAEALLALFSRVGIPHTILSDQGSNFTSKLMGELHRLLGVKPLFSSVYHAQGNERQERVHLTLKNSLKKLCEDKPKDWDRYLVATLFALRELPSDRSGFSAFELLYGRKVRGPISVLKDLWSDTEASVDQRNVYQYILDLRSKLEECTEIAIANSKISQNRFSSYFDLKAKNRKLEVGDEALILLPDCANKLLMSWKGPFKVIKRLTKVNYVLACDDSEKVYHINLLKKYFRRATICNATVINENLSPDNVPVNLFYVAHAIIIDETSLQIDQPCLSDPVKIELVHDLSLDVGPISECQTKSLPTISDELSSDQSKDLAELLDEYGEVLSDKPGHTKTVVHSINLMTTAPIRTKVYPVPVHLRDTFDKEVDDLLDLGIIQRSTSDFCSPVVLIKKADGTYRLTIDYRTLNSFSKFDCEPPCNAEEDLHKLTGSKLFSEIDITKAYHQVELDESSRPLTAFPTSRGLMEYTRLPFGLLTACATYARLMRLVLSDVEGVMFFFIIFL